MNYNMLQKAAHYNAINLVEKSDAIPLSFN